MLSSAFYGTGEDNGGRRTDNLAGHPSELSVPIIPTIFMPNALPIYPGLEQARSMMGSILGGLFASFT